MQGTFGLLQVELKYVCQRDDVLCYQRWIPEDLRERCRKSKVRERLQSTSIAAAERESARLNAKYERARDALSHYQWAIPAALQARYGSPLISPDHHAADPLKAARAVARLNLQSEREWAALKASPSASPGLVKAHAKAYLQEHGLAPPSVTMHWPLSI